MDDIMKISQKERKRIETMVLLNINGIKHKEAAQRLGLTARQTKRLLKKYRKYGEAGLISKKRGKPSNNKYGEKFKETVRVIIEEKYLGFGPKFAAEKLREQEKIFLDKETLRKYMIEWKLWIPKLKKYCVIHQQRARRACFGELVQIDGSHHDWFEGRGERCCLLVFVDDATSRIVELRFFPSETTQAYFECVKRYIKKYGRPLAFYNDKHSIFLVNNKEGHNQGKTQFQRAMEELDIKIICANSPQAKGRVERSNRTLQDRLIKEMRLRGINNINDANNYVEEFRKDYNRRFGKSAISNVDAHRRTLPNDMMLDAILCERHYRKLSDNLEFRFENKIYQIINCGKYNLKRANIIICRYAHNEIKVWYKKMFVEYKEFKQQLSITSASRQETNALVDDLCMQAADKINAKQAWMNVPFLRLIAWP
jgi:transposase